MRVGEQEFEMLVSKGLVVLGEVGPRLFLHISTKDKINLLV
jgi:hypothetical protein